MKVQIVFYVSNDFSSKCILTCCHLSLTVAHYTRYYTQSYMQVVYCNHATTMYTTNLLVDDFRQPRGKYKSRNRHICFNFSRNSLEIWQKSEHPLCRTIASQKNLLVLKTIFSFQSYCNMIQYSRHSIFEKTIQVF